MTDPSRFVVPPHTMSTTATDDPASSDAPGPGQPNGGDDTSAAASPAGASPQGGATPAAAPAEPSAAELRFQSCRWRKAEVPPYCSHPEVQPFAGTNGFKPESWCPGCAFYKLRRNPRRDY